MTGDRTAGDVEPATESDGVAEVDGVANRDGTVNAVSRDGAAGSDAGVGTPGSDAGVGTPGSDAGVGTPGSDAGADRVGTPAWAHARARAVLDELDEVIVGKRDALELVLLGVLAGGHVLLDDLPGMGKTLLARSLARVLGLSFSRVQFTPDLLPQDLTGSAIYNQKTAEFGFREGPVFTNFLLADEINRTPPKTQAALLEAMEERQVSTDGVTRPLPAPFVVLATENPIEYEGTYPLPEAQLDRFVLRTRLGYLDAELEADMVHRRLRRGSAVSEPARVTDTAELLDMIAALEQVEVHDDLLDYIVALVVATREHPKAQVGASPRGTLAVTQLARGAAVVAGRDYVTPEDVKRVAPSALGHRLVLRPELWVRRVSGEDVVAEVIDAVPTPTTQPGARPEPARPESTRPESARTESTRTGPTGTGSTRPGSR